MIASKNIGETLKAYRKTSGMTLKEVAAASKLSVSFISDMERGRTQPSLSTIEALCAVYQTPLVVKFGGSFKFGGAW